MMDSIIRDQTVLIFYHLEAGKIVNVKCQMCADFYLQPIDTFRMCFLTIFGASDSIKLLLRACGRVSSL
jgi:hypothetical protein